MSLLASLTKLDSIDRQIHGLRSRVDSARRYLQSQAAQLEEVEGRLEELRTRSRHVKAKIANLEVEGAAMDELLEKFRRDLNSSATNKQYSAVLSELNTVKAARSKLDDGILEEMAQIEQIDEQITEVEAQRVERAKVRDVAATQFEERETEVGERLAELEAERETAAAAIPGPELSIFEEIADTYDGEAMASVDEIDRRHREYACNACNMHMPFEQVAALMSPGCGIIRCTACGRILYMQEDVRGALTPK